jgi:hypothetical protein
MISVQERLEELNWHAIIIVWMFYIRCGASDDDDDFLCVHSRNA